MTSSTKQQIPVLYLAVQPGHYQSLLSVMGCWIRLLDCLLQVTWMSGQWLVFKTYILLFFFTVQILHQSWISEAISVSYFTARLFPSHFLPWHLQNHFRPSRVIAKKCVCEHTWLSRAQKGSVRLAQGFVRGGGNALCVNVYGVAEWQETGQLSPAV